MRERRESQHSPPGGDYHALSRRFTGWYASRDSIGYIVVSVERPEFRYAFSSSRSRSRSSLELRVSRAWWLLRGMQLCWWGGFFFCRIARMDRSSRMMEPLFWGGIYSSSLETITLMSCKVDHDDGGRGKSMSDGPFQPTLLDTLSLTLCVSDYGIEWIVGGWIWSVNADQ